MAPGVIFMYIEKSSYVLKFVLCCKNIKQIMPSVSVGQNKKLLLWAVCLV
jgi:hypothetical protein